MQKNYVPNRLKIEPKYENLKIEKINEIKPKNNTEKIYCDNNVNELNKLKKDKLNCNTTLTQLNNKIKKTEAELADMINKYNKERENVEKLTTSQKTLTILKNKYERKISELEANRSA